MQDYLITTVSAMFLILHTSDERYQSIPNKCWLWGQLERAASGCLKSVRILPRFNLKKNPDKKGYMELELYPWKFCRARPSQMCCRAEAEQDTVTLSCRERPGKTPVGSIEQLPFQWAGKGPEELSSIPRVQDGAEAALCVRSRQGCPSAGSWSLLGAGVWWPGTECVASSLSLAGSCRVCQARAGMEGGQVRCDLLAQQWTCQKRVEWSKERECRRKHAPACSTVWHCWALSLPQEQVCFTLEYKYTKLSKSWKNWQWCEETH